MERHTYFLLTAQITDYPSYATHTLSGRRHGSNLETFDYKAITLVLTELTGDKRGFFKVFQIKFAFLV